MRQVPSSERLPRSFSGGISGRITAPFFSWRVGAVNKNRADLVKLPGRQNVPHGTKGGSAARVGWGV